MSDVDTAVDEVEKAVTEAVEELSVDEYIEFLEEVISQLSTRLDAAKQGRDS